MSHDYRILIHSLSHQILEYKFPTKSLSKGKPISMEGTIRLSKQLLHNRLVQVSLWSRDLVTLSIGVIT